MALSILLVIIGIALLVLGGELLLRGAIGIAMLLQMPPALIGLTIVAAGTSIPELAVSVAAGLQGKPDITVGNVIGSNIFNISVIIGLCAVIRPIPFDSKLLQLEYPVLVLVTLAALAVCNHGVISRMDGVFFLACYVAFMAYVVRLVREKLTPGEVQKLRDEMADIGNQAVVPPSRLIVILQVIAGSVLLAVGVEVTLEGAIDLGTRFGLSERIIGLTIVAAGTGAPEAVVSAMAAIRNRADVAIGNVIGSNLFNTLAILGLSSFISPLPIVEGIRNFDNWWLLGLTLAIFPIARSGKLINRWEGGLLLAGFVTYTTWLLIRN